MQKLERKNQKFLKNSQVKFKKKKIENHVLKKKCKNYLNI